jgi:hypothetical protein
VAITFDQEIQIGRSRHDIDEAGLYPDFYDPEVLEAGWPANIQGNASSNLAVPNVITPDLPEDFAESGPHPDEDETL